MKYIILILSLIIMFNSCELINYCLNGYIPETKIPYINIDDKISVNSFEDLQNFVNGYIEYKLDKLEYWQLPEQTLERLTGDCEDKAILYGCLLYSYFGIEGEFIISFFDLSDHAWIDAGEYSFGFIGGGEEIRRYTLGQALYIAENIF